MCMQPPLVPWLLSKGQVQSRFQAAIMILRYQLLHKMEVSGNTSSMWCVKTTDQLIPQALVLEPEPAQAQAPVAILLTVLAAI